MSIDNIILLVLAVIYLIMASYTKHVYKCEHMGWTEPNVGRVLGSILGALTEGIAWYWVIVNVKNYI